MVSRNRTRLAVWLLASGLALSLVVNTILSLGLYESFVKLQFLRVFPLGHVPADAPVHTSIPGRPSIAFWGDSRAHFWNTELLADFLVAHDHAHGAITSTQLLLQLRTEPAERTDYAIVQIGINDLHPLGVLQAHKSRVLERLHGNIVAIRDAMLERSDIVILTTIFPPGRVPLARRFTWDPTTLQHLAGVNDLIRDLTDGKRVVLLDAHALLSDSANYLKERFTDGDFFLHVNPEAYAQLNAELRQVLARHHLPRK